MVVDREIWTISGFLGVGSDWIDEIGFGCRVQTYGYAEQISC